MHALPVPPPAADAGVGRARRRIEQAGLDRADRDWRTSSAATFRVRSSRSIPTIAACSAQRSYPLARARSATPVDLALIAVPWPAVLSRPRRRRARRHRGGGHLSRRRRRIRTMRRRWQRELARSDHRSVRIRVVGPHSLRRDPYRHRPQRDARHDHRARRAGSRSSRSRARCARAMLDFARVGRHRLLDGRRARRRHRRRFRRAARRAAQRSRNRRHPALRRRRSATRARFLSALRAAARTKPVVVLQGRPVDRSRVSRRTRPVARCGVRCRDEARRGGAREDLCAALRRRAHPRDGSDRARRSARDRHQWARARHARRRQRRRPRRRARGTRAGDRSALDALLPPEVASAAIRSTCAATRRRRASPRRVDAALADPQVDAVLALHVRAARSPARPMRARAVAAVARGSTKPVLARVAGRDRSARGGRGARGRRRRQLLHAGECGRRVLVPVRVSPQPGMAARSAAAAARAARAGPARGSSAFGSSAASAHRSC